MAMRQFLEPIYLNTSMVLNAAGYLFGGVATTDERTKTMGKEGSGGVKAGIPFLQNVIGLAAEAKASQTLAVREVRELTVGGLHMNVLDELHKEKMIETMTVRDFEGFELRPGTYVESRAILRPVEYHAILRLFQVVAPLVGQAASDFANVKELFKQSNPDAGSSTLALPAGNGNSTPRQLSKKMAKLAAQPAPEQVWWAHYPDAVSALAQRLEEDFLRSQELEVVLEDPSTGQPFGVAGLSLEGYEVDQLRARISDIEATVIGKVTRFVSCDDTLPLLQQTAVMQTVDLARKVVAAASSSTTEFDEQFENFKGAVQGVFPLQVDGPAIRLATMSVCI